MIIRATHGNSYSIPFSVIQFQYSCHRKAANDGSGLRLMGSWRTRSFDKIVTLVYKVCYAFYFGATWFPAGNGSFPPWRCQSARFLVRRSAATPPRNPLISLPGRKIPRFRSGNRSCLIRSFRMET